MTKGNILLNDIVLVYTDFCKVFKETFAKLGTKLKKLTDKKLAVYVLRELNPHHAVFKHQWHETARKKKETIENLVNKTLRFLQVN